MSYSKTNWTNNSAPAINADNLNKIEQGIYDNDSAITTANGNIAINSKLWEILFDTANYFSTSTSYAVGDYTIYNNKLYKCTTAHSAGDWDSNDFTESTIFVD